MKMDQRNADASDLQKRLYLAFENAPVGMLVRDIGSAQPHANQALLDMLGYQADEMGRIGLDALMLPERGGLDGRLDAELQAGKRDSYQVERRYLHKEGYTVWCKADVSLVRDSGGEPRFSVSVLEEITARRQVDASLRRLVLRYEQILNAVGWGICRIDRDGMIAFANPAAAAMLGWDSDALTGQSVSVLREPTLGSAACPAAGCPICGALRDGLTRKVDSDRFCRKDGVCFAVEYTATPIVEDGAVKGVVILFVEAFASPLPWAGGGPKPSSDGRPQKRQRL